MKRMLLLFPGGSDSKESDCKVGDQGSIPRVGKSPGGGHGDPLQYSCLENPHGQRSLVGYSPLGRKELGTTEGLTLSLSPPPNSVKPIHTIYHVSSPFFFFHRGHVQTWCQGPGRGVSLQISWLEHLPVRAGL